MTTKLTVRKVLNAYKKTGLIPIQHKFFQKKKGKWCGCAATALYCANHEIDMDEECKSSANRQNFTIRIRDYADNIFNKMGGDFDYFLEGFDDGIPFYQNDSHSLGVACGKALGLINEDN